MLKICSQKTNLFISVMAYKTTPAVSWFIMKERSVLIALGNISIGLTIEL